MPPSQTRTYVLLDIPQAYYDYIARRLREAGYQHTFRKKDGVIALDMHGIALIPQELGAEEHAHDA